MGTSNKTKQTIASCDVVQKTSKSSGKDKLSVLVLTLVFLEIAGFGGEHEH